MAGRDPKQQPRDVATESTQSPAQDGFRERDEKTEPGVQTQLRKHSSERKRFWRDRTMERMLGKNHRKITN